jgi:curved DNA-binding protein
VSVTFQDYYETLDVSRSASAAELSKAYRKLARTYHPDVNKDPGAEDRFKQISEAYEVLKDPEKRKRYDALGENWKNGQEFTPPPGWEDVFSQFGGAGAARGRSGAQFNTRQASAGGFSDFFNSLFGNASTGGGQSPFGAGGGFSGMAPRPQPGRSHEAELIVSLRDVYHRATKTISFEVMEYGPDGIPQRKIKNYQVKIPAGITDGKVIRLAGQGGLGSNGGAAGDLLLKIKFGPDAQFKADGQKILTTVKVAPWEAALGAKVHVPTLDKAVTLSIPPGTQSGKSLRVKGKGLPKKDGTHDHLLVEVVIVVPEQLSEEEKTLFEQLQAASRFNPRQDA